MVLKFSFTKCKKEFTYGSNLRQHISKVHLNSSVALGKTQDGNCCCLSCNYRCRCIVELQKHSTRVSNQVFKTESLTFSNNEGNLQKFCNVLIFWVVWKSWSWVMGVGNGEWGVCNKGIRSAIASVSEFFHFKVLLT